jgi:hypothetical protein
LFKQTQKVGVSDSVSLLSIVLFSSSKIGRALNERNRAALNERNRAALNERNRAALNERNRAALNERNRAALRAFLYMGERAAVF